MIMTTDHWLHGGEATERAVEMIERAVNLYRRFVLVLGMTGSKNTNALRETAASPGKLLPLPPLKRNAGGRQSLSRWQNWPSLHRCTKPGKARLASE